MTRKSKNPPRHAQLLETYDQLRSFARAFRDGHLTSVVLVGSPGIGKTHSFRAELHENVCWIAGNATAFGAYLKIYDHVDRPIIFDDVDDFCHQPAGIKLLKALCQTDAIRTVGWHTQARELDRRNVPREFKTSSSVAIIANEWHTTNANVQAVEDRVHLLNFQPSASEIHRQAAKWYWDQEIFDFVGRHLCILDDHSFRIYVRAYELKRAGMNWTSTVLAHCHQGTARYVAELLSDPRFSSEEERVREFVQSGHGCRATYYNHRKALPKLEDTPSIPLFATAPDQIFSDSWSELGAM